MNMTPLAPPFCYYVSFYFVMFLKESADRWLNGYIENGPIEQENEKTAKWQGGTVALNI